MENKTVKWGYGVAPLVRPSTKEETEVVVFVPDTHVPYHDQELFNSALRVIKKVKPHRVVHLGDLNDFHSISRWNASLERLDELQNEIDLASALLKQLRKASPNAVLDLCEGNHDARLRKYIMDKGRALASLRSLDLSHQLDLSTLGITLHEGHGFRLRPNYVVRHGTVVRKGAGNSAKAEALMSKTSGISGHTHRAAKWQEAGYVRQEWIEAGTLSRLDPPYTLGIPDWTPGLVVGQFSTKTTTFVTEVLSSLDGRFYYGGKAF